MTAHMSQHDRGVSCHACPLTFPTLRVHAGSERREKKPLCFLLGSLSATIWSALPLSLSWFFSLFLPLSLSAVTGAVFDCSPDKRELYDLSPGLAVPSPGLILKPNSSPSPPLPPSPYTPLLLQLQGKAVFWQEMNSSQMSAGT